MESLGDAREHLESLVYPGFLREADLDWLEQLPRFLAGLERRLEKLERNPGRDRQLTAEVRPWWERYRERAAAHRAKGLDDPELAVFRRLLEEWRISLFAQELGSDHRDRNRQTHRPRPCRAGPVPQTQHPLLPSDRGDFA